MTEAQYIDTVQRLMRRLCIWSQTLQQDEQHVLSNALLDTAALRMRNELGAAETATILWRLADVVSREKGAAPGAQHPVNLRAHQE